MPDALTIWTNARFSPADLDRFREAMGSHKLIVGSSLLKSNAGTADPGLSLANVDIAFGQPDVHEVIASRRLKWVHVNSASYTRYDREDVRQAIESRRAALTTSSSVFREPCAQHVLAMMLALSRRLPQGFANQSGPCGWPAREMRSACRLLNGQSAILYGYGSIARRLSELLKPFDMNLLGVRRFPKGNESIEVVTADAADARLGSADHVIDLLPDSPDSSRYFTADRFSKMKPGAIFYNIGRGATVDPDALMGALATGHVSAAFLDVTDPEPLPPDHPLWTAPNVQITPHIAGGRADESVALMEHFLANLRRFTGAETLLDRVM